MKTTFPLKKIIVIILILGIGYGVYARFFKKAAPSNLVTIKTQVKRGDLENAIKVIGSSKLVDEQKMKFNQIGKVAKINFKE
jgi:sorbitol-specific phosphotransferase system component IIA